MHSSESPMTVDAERRKKLRKKPLSLVYVELPSANGGMMRDLSEEGFAMRAMIPLRAGQPISFVFSLDEFTRIEGEGVVDWIEENGRIAGVKFVQVPATARDQIDEWLLRSDEPATHEEDAPSPHPPVAPTMEELREEMRTTPPRPVPPKKEETSSSEAEEAPAAPPPQSSEDQSSTQLSVSTPSAPDEEIVFPLGAVELLAVSEENSEPAPPSAQEENPAPETASSSASFMIERRWRMPASSSPVSEVDAPEDPVSPDRNPNVPDISSILMQPAGVSSGHCPAALREPLLGLEGPPAARRLRWTEDLTLSRAISIMFILALTVGTYVFHREVGEGLIWLGERMGGKTERTSHASANATVAGQPEPSAPAAAPNLPPSGLASSERPIQEQPAARSVPPSAADPEPSHSLPTANSSPSASASSRDPGQSEYSQAEQLLRANSGVGTGDAVQLLWISVEKGNPYAEIALADLYWRGKGVPKNCDQTRILLAAAARKGNPEAHRRLEQFQQEGCE
jgi:hypothetical protein